VSTSHTSTATFISELEA